MYSLLYIISTNTGLYYTKILHFSLRSYVSKYSVPIPSLYLAHNTREEGGVVEEKRDDAEENS